MRLTPQTYALTAVCHERHRIFQRIVKADLMVATLIRYRDAGQVLLHAFVIMPDYLHVMFTPAQSIEKTAQLIKGGYCLAVRKTKAISGKRATSRTVSPTWMITRPKWDISQNNPARKGIQNHPWVYKTGSWRMDPAPDAFAQPHERSGSRG